MRQPSGQPAVATPPRLSNGIIPNRLYLLAPGFSKDQCKEMAQHAAAVARTMSPRLSGRAAEGIKAYYGDGFFGVRWDRCLAPGTRVLTEHWEWVPVEKLAEGDRLIAFDEEVPSGTRGEMSRGRRYRTSVVEKVGGERLDTVEIEFDDGFKVRCTSDHPWLTKRTSTSSARQWIQSQDLKAGDSLGVYLPAWDFDDTNDGGWMAGLLDGEGSLSFNERVEKKANCATLSFAQNEGPVLDRALSWLESHGYQVRVTQKGNVGRTKTCVTVIVLGGFAEQMRLLGSVRPGRLLAKVRHENRYMQAQAERQVVKVTSLGCQEIVTLQTSTRTYLAEGMGSHNTYLWYQEGGIGPYTMKNLAGKVIPMWVDDWTGEMARKNPKAKTRITANGRRQILIFRKAGKIGARKRAAVRDPKGRLLRWRSVPQSYPGAPGRITHREWKAPDATTGRITRLISRPHVGVRWRHPGLVPREFMQHALQQVALSHGIHNTDVYATYARS